MDDVVDGLSTILKALITFLGGGVRTCTDTGQSVMCVRSTGSVPMSTSPSLI